jgi:hypothetical protein
MRSPGHSAFSYGPTFAALGLPWASPHRWRRWELFSSLQKTPVAPPSTKYEESTAVKPIGKQVWAIAEGYIPGWSHGPEPQMTSHETVCILNTSDSDAHIRITIFFADKDPAGPYDITVPARRTKHVRFNDLSLPQSIPRDTDYSSVIESDVPIVVQHSRLDSRQDCNALLSTIAYAHSG